MLEHGFLSILLLGWVGLFNYLLVDCELGRLYSFPLGSNSPLDPNDICCFCPSYLLFYPHPKPSPPTPSFLGEVYLRECAWILASDWIRSKSAGEAHFSHSKIVLSFLVLFSLLLVLSPFVKNNLGLFVQA